MGALFEVVVILAVAVAAFMFFQFALPVAIALVGGLLALVAFTHGDGQRFVAAVIVLVSAGFAQLIADAMPPPQVAVSAPPKAEPPPPEPPIESPPRNTPTPPDVPAPRAEQSPPHNEETTETPPPRSPAPRPARPRPACSPAAPAGDRLALCGGVRMVRRGTCPYGWKTLWPAEFAGYSPACPSPPRPTRRRLERSWDECPPLRIRRPPWFASRRLLTDD